MATMRCILCGHTFTSNSKTSGCPLCVGEIVEVARGGIMAKKFMWSSIDISDDSEFPVVYLRHKEGNTGEMLALVFENWDEVGELIGYLKGARDSALKDKAR
jgi:hypothetical protein